MKFLIGRWFPPEHVKGCWPDKVECAVPPLGPGEKSRAYYDLDSRGIEVRQAVIAAGIITRNRPELLKRTILSLQQSEYPISRIVVCDDSTDEATALMLAAEFPDVHWTEGPRRGRSANRNNVIRAAASEYVVVSDDDVLVDPHFIVKTMAQAVISPDGMFFTATGQDGQIILPLAMSFLGFWTKRYAPGEPYTTSNSHCFVLSKSVTERVAFDEIMDEYGTEEADFTYRVAGGGLPHSLHRGLRQHAPGSEPRTVLATRRESIVRNLQAVHVCRSSRPRSDRLRHGGERAPYAPFLPNEPLARPDPSSLEHPPRHGYDSQIPTEPRQLKSLPPVRIR